jgi:hypothetical protein
MEANAVKHVNWRTGAALVIIAAVLVASCISPETQRQLDNATLELKGAQNELAAAKAAGSQDLAALTIRVLEAEKALAATKDVATKERVNSGLSIADATLSTAGGILQYIPGVGSLAGLILTLAGGAIGGMKSKMGGANA